MRKINRFLLLSVLSALTLTGCGTKSNSGNGSDTTPTSDTGSTDTNPGTTDTDPGTTDTTPDTTDTNTDTDTTTPEEQDITVTLNNLSSDVVNVSVDKTIVKADEQVVVTVTSIDKGYDVIIVRFTRSDEEAISFTNAGVNQYSLVVPANGIINVSAEVQGKDIQGYLHDDKGLVAETAYQTVDGVTKELTLEVDGKNTYWTFVYGATVKVQLAEKDDYVPTALNVDGTDYTLDEEGYATFKVEVEDYDDFFLDIRPVYEDNSPLTGDYAFEINETSHLSATVYAENGTTRIVGTNVNDIVYVKVVSDDEDYSVKKVEVETRSSDVGGANKLEATYDSGLDMYRFKVPYAYNKLVKINLYELNNSLLRGTGVAGTYLTVGISAASHVFSEFDDRYFTVNDGGEMSLGSKNPNAPARTDTVTEVREGGVLYTDSYNSPRYGDKLFFGSEDGSYAIRTPFTSYDFIAVKKQSVDDLDSIYTVAGERMSIDGTYYLAFRFYRSGEEYATAFMDYAKKTVLFNPDFAMLNGDEITDDKAVYTLGDEIVIGYNGEGGNSARCFMGDVYGTYTNGESTLFVGGLYKATYDNEEFDYVAEGTTLTLTKDGRTVVIEVNNDLSLVYGGFISRDKCRNVCVFDKEKRMMLKCDAKMYEMIRDESKNNGKINNMIDQLRIDNA